jgi:hypothetical protein
VIERVSDEVDLRGLGQTLWRRRGIVVVPLVAGLIIGLVFGFALWQPPVQEAHALIQSAKGTGDLYSNGAGIALLLQDYSFQQRALQSARLGDAFTAGGDWSVTATPQPGQDDIVAMTVRHQGSPGPDVRSYAQALTDELSREADKMVNQHRQAVLDNLTQISGTTEKLMDANGRSMARVFSDSARTESIDQFLRLSAYNSTAQGLMTLLFQTQRDLTLQLINFRRAGVVGDIWMTQTPPQRRGARAAVAVTLLGAVAGVALAFVTEAMRPGRRFDSEDAAGGHTPDAVRGTVG